MSDGSTIRPSGYHRSSRLSTSGSFLIRSAQIGVNRARKHDVHPHPMASIFERQRARHCDHSRFGGAVGRVAESGQGVDGADSHDGAGALLDHAGSTAWTQLNVPLSAVDASRQPSGSVLAIVGWRATPALLTRMSTSPWLAVSRAKHAATASNRRCLPPRRRRQCRLRQAARRNHARHRCDRGRSAARPSGRRAS